MDSHLALGFFALYVVVVSLWRLMSGRGLPPVAEASQVLERRGRLLPHFLVHVAAPMVVGVVFISSGIVSLDGGTARPYDAVPQQHVYHHVAAAMEMNWQAKFAAGERWPDTESMETASLVWTNIP